MDLNNGSRRDQVERILLDLVAIPSITGTKEEARAADWIHDRLARLAWFQENPDHLHRITQDLHDTELPKEAVFALVRAKKPSARTLLFIGHLDVVDVDVYGKLRSFAFDPEALKERMRTLSLPEDVMADLESDNFLFGRGVMDMKAGVAIEIDLLEEFAHRRDLYDVNVAILIVSDEESDSGGMLAALPFLRDICAEMELEIEAVINTEPSGAGLPGNREPVIFSGTMGKVLPFFYALGYPTHVGNYFQGLSSALLISKISSLIEGNPDLADVAHGEVTVPPICLDQGTRERGYSVTVPDRAYSYFNYLTIGKKPKEILDEMGSAAREAADDAVDHFKKSLATLREKGYSGEGRAGWDIPVVSFEELKKRAMAMPRYDVEMARTVRKMPLHIDLREKSLRLVEKTLEIAGATGPTIVFGMLPPFMPPRISVGDSPRERALRGALDGMKDLAKEHFNVTFQEAVFYAGLCDLSYVGSDMADDELEAMAHNTPGWNDFYSVPFEAMKALDCPVVNVGPEGRDAHKMTERLERGYSLDVLPRLLRELVRGYPGQI